LVFVVEVGVRDFGELGVDAVGAVLDVVFEPRLDAFDEVGEVGVFRGRHVCFFYFLGARRGADGLTLGFGAALRGAYAFLEGEGAEEEAGDGRACVAGEAGFAAEQSPVEAVALVVFFFVVGYGDFCTVAARLHEVYALGDELVVVDSNAGSAIQTVVELLAG
jgi:hypothetical protein